MAEIGIARRHSGPGSWMLGLLVLALFVVLLAGALSEAPEPVPVGEGTTQGAASEADPPERPPLPPVPVAGAEAVGPWTPIASPPRAA